MLDKAQTPTQQERFGLPPHRALLSMPKAQTLTVHSATAMLHMARYRLDRIVQESNDIAQCSIRCFSLLFLYSLSSPIKLICPAKTSSTFRLVASSKGVYPLCSWSKLPTTGHSTVFVADFSPAWFVTSTCAYKPGFLVTHK